MNAKTELTPFDCEQWLIENTREPRAPFPRGSFLKAINAESGHLFREILIDFEFDGHELIEGSLVLTTYDKETLSKKVGAVIAPPGKKAIPIGLDGYIAFNLDTTNKPFYVATTDTKKAMKIAETGYPVVMASVAELDRIFSDDRSIAILDGSEIFNKQDIAQYTVKEIREKLTESLTSEVESNLIQQEQSGQAPYILWKDKKDSGKPLDTIDNLKSLLNFYSISSRYNVVKKTEEHNIPDLVCSLDNREVSIFAEIISLCKTNHLSTENTKLYLSKIANETQYSPVINWIESKKWDGQNRINDFLKTVKVEDPKKLKNGELFHEHLIKKWLIQAVAAAFCPKISAAGILVFQGKQGLGKTSWFKSLVPREFDNELIKSDSSLDPHDKDSVLSNISYWLVELGELNSTFSKADIAALKSFITRDFDEVRKPYAQTPSKFGRKTVFFASVNDSDFLVDPTGNRRYWTVPASYIQYVHNFDMQQVWAEVYELYKAGESFRLDHEASDLLSSINDHHMTANPVEDKMDVGFYWDRMDRSTWQWLTATDIYMELFGNKPTAADARKVTQYLRNKGIELKNSGGKKYFVPAFKKDVPRLI
ncbi:VapE domain-containing protein [Acinetobacter sp. YH12114]|uniref:VapE domain-containing protein n=1 Tax=Acinetobacter sp. YH12114 TaxID=2601101 RepID=UPI0015D199C3|nr:VapE domain-containing protein [Acinetobacter sp. YH12114]